MTISEILLPEFDQEMANTRAILECVPEEKFTWKPQWAAYTINQDQLELTPATKPFNAATKQELMDTFSANISSARAAIAGANDEHLSKTWTLIYGGKTVLAMPRAAILRTMVMSHLIHHRGQLGVYLRLNDIPIPGMYGPSADARAAF